MSRRPASSSEAAAALAAANDACGLPAGSRVVVAMSGGVDSTVTATLLKRAGYDVIGITLQLYAHDGGPGRKGACCAGQDIHDAREVAGILRIPHYVLDYESRFQTAVIDDFADTYLRGETPVPCIRCNQTVKFRDLMDVALDLGAAALATGHYARRLAGESAVGLHRAVDPRRDQSYFLFATTKAQLDFLRFPLGGLTKPQVREVAAELSLAVAEKPDSQDICFVPRGHYTTVIDSRRRGADRAGDIVHVDGRVLGRHAGVSRFTVGQRRGLNVAVGDPLFVVGIDAAERRVLVGPREALRRTAIRLRECNWLGDQPSLEEAAEAGLPVLAKVRSTSPAAPASLMLRDGAPWVLFGEAEEGISPGQACVLYDDADPTRLLGGGFIAAGAEVPDGSPLP